MWVTCYPDFEVFVGKASQFSLTPFCSKKLPFQSVNTQDGIPQIFQICTSSQNYQ